MRTCGSVEWVGSLGSLAMCGYLGGGAMETDQGPVMLARRREGTSPKDGDGRSRPG